MRWWWRRDEPVFNTDELVFNTHTPGFFKVGEVVQWREGCPRFRITRLVALAPTRLIDGGRAPCYEVRGVKVDE